MPEPVKYIEKTRAYYEAQGFDRSYQWATNDEIPWHKLPIELSEATVTFVTTAVPDGTIPKLSRSALSLLMSDMPTKFRTDELSWDKEATHMRDLGSFIPLAPLRTLAASGMIGRVSERFHFIPTEYSQSNTIQKDAPAIAQACVADGVDVAILVPL